MMPDDERATIDEMDKPTKSRGKALYTSKIYAEAEISLKETWQIASDLGNKFSNGAECTLVSSLQTKFKQFGFHFDILNHNRKPNN
jgi:hypothetical protein